MSRIDTIGTNGNDGLHYEVKTKLNGGDLSFVEAADLWKKYKPSYHVEDIDSWAGKFTMDQWRKK